MKKLISSIISLLKLKKEKKGITVVSLFDGMSCAMIALDELGIKVDKYIAFEIESNPIKVSSHNNPDIIHMGDVKQINYEEILKICGGKVDLLIGGSPCQDLSIAKSNRQGLDGARSGLFWNYVEAKERLNPKYFVLENVASMSQDNKNRISEAMGVDFININSEKLSAQKRNRLYWTNIPNVKQPEVQEIYLKDIIEDGYTDKNKSYCIDANYFKGSNYEMYIKKSKRQIIFEKQSIPSTAVKEGQEVWIKKYVEGNVFMSKAEGTKLTDPIKFNDKGFRKLTVLECERLQCVPDGYTNVEGVSNTERYKMIGNGFTVSVIKHILSEM